MEKELHIELFDNYINGLLNEAETAEFVNKLNSDAELKADFEVYLRTVRIVKEHRKNELKNYLKQHAGTKKVSLINSWIPYSAVASILVIFSLYFFVNKQKNNVNIVENPTKNPDQAIQIETTPDQVKNPLPVPDIVQKMDSRLSGPHYTYDGRTLTIYNLNQTSKVNYIKEKNQLIIDKDTFSIELTTKTTKLAVY